MQRSCFKAIFVGILIFLFCLIYYIPIKAINIIGENKGFTIVEVAKPAFDSGLSEPSGPSRQGEPNDPTQAYSHGNPSNEEQLMLELINASRSGPQDAAANYGIDLNVDLPPGTISNSPKQPLAFNPKLIVAAREHSQWMVDAQTFSHTGQGGSSSEDRIEDAGYELTGSWAQGENLGTSGTSGPFDVLNHIQLIIEDLFLSPDHRVVTLSENFNEIGIGSLTGNFQGVNTLMVTQKFATSAFTPKYFLVGVVYEDSNGNDQYDIGEGLQGITITPDKGSYYSVTSESGGFAIPLPHSSGTLSVTASSQELSQSVTKEINMTGENVKLDFVISE